MQSDLPRRVESDVAPAKLYRLTDASSGIIKKKEKRCITDAKSLAEIYLGKE
jgi:hypothetical protein